MIKKVSLFLIALMLFSCKRPTGTWFDSLAVYNQAKSAALKIEILKMDNENDTSILNYQVRIYPDKQWLENNPTNTASELNYRADSFFFIRAGGAVCPPGFVQPVAGGIKNCYTYLISFNADKQLKKKKLMLVYTDRYIDGKTYTLDLKKQ